MLPPPNVLQLGFFVAVMQIMMVQLRLFAGFACIKQDIICYKMEQQQCKRHCEQFEEHLEGICLGSAWVLSLDVL
jgi:hypothetical protein